MIQVGGVWLPDGELHLVSWMKQTNRMVNGRLTYQYNKLEGAMAEVRKRRTAIDVGAHCGLWSMHLADMFDVVHAFEPVAAHRECFLKNIPGSWRPFNGGNDIQVLDARHGPGGVLLHPYALGEKDAKVVIHTAPTSSGDSWVDPTVTPTEATVDAVPMHMLDDVLATADEVDFIKLDCEGYEFFALRGGHELLKRCRPTIIVEQKPGRAQKFGLDETQAVTYLRSLGAVLRRSMSGDFIMSWDK